MTDKEMIINGVNVDECKHYEDHTLYDCNETCEINGGIVCTKCEDNSNCYYKQLKRKEQECDQLKVQLLDQKVKTLKASGIICVLEQTLTEIKGMAEGMNTECFYDDFDCKDCDMKNGCTYQGRLKILQKISECEVEDEM